MVLAGLVLGLVLGFFLLGALVFYFTRHAGRSRGYTRLPLTERHAASSSSSSSSSSSLSASSASSSFSYPSDLALVNPPFGDQHTFTLIWLHGLGDTAQGWLDGVESFKLRKTRIVLPTAPVRPVTINGGIHMPAWFDVTGLTIGDQEDAHGIEQACTALGRMVRREIEEFGVKPAHVAVGGFSQGGAVALHTAFCQGFLDMKIGAVVGLSAWLPRGASILRGGRDVPKLSRLNAATPLFMGHGTSDPLVRVQFGELTSKILREGGVPTTFKTYRGMQHETCSEELTDVSKFLSQVFADAEAQGK